MCLCVFMCMCMCNMCAAHVSGLQRPKEDVRSSEAGVTGVCEPPSVGAGNQTLVRCKSHLSSTPQNFLNNFPDLVYF